MIEAFEVQDQILGTGDNSVYTFSFRISSLTDLLIYVQDAAGAIIQEIRGDDASFLSSVVFDSIKGGGTITLLAFLPDGYVMSLFTAPDAPNQPVSFPNKSSFSFNAIESALDYLALLIQRVAFLAQRSVKLHDLDDVTVFDPTLPLSLSSYPGGIVSIKDDGTGFEVVTTVTEITQTLASGYSVKNGTSRALPQVITAATGFVPRGIPRELMFVKSAGGTVIITANPQIPNGAYLGQELTLIGCSATDMPQVTNGNGLDLNGSKTLGNGDSLGLIWDGTKWSEIFRRGA